MRLLPFLGRAPRNRTARATERTARATEAIAASVRREEAARTRAQQRADLSRLLADIRAETAECRRLAALDLAPEDRAAVAARLRLNAARATALHESLR